MQNFIDPLPADERDLTKLTATDLSGWQLHHFTETDSTNTQAKLLPTNSLVVADYQTAGRGRLDRSWEAPAGAGLLVSAVLALDVADHYWGWVPLLAGVAVVEALRNLAVPAGLKWPNDILLADQKLGGILVERVANKAVIGIGININQTQLRFPNATSLAGYSLSRQQVLLELAATLAKLPTVLQSNNPEEFRAKYLPFCVTIGREVWVQQPAQETRAGIALDLDDFGCLQLESGLGVWSVSAGDVIHATHGTLD